MGGDDDDFEHLLGQLEDRQAGSGSGSDEEGGEGPAADSDDERQPAAAPAEPDGEAEQGGAAGEGGEAPQKKKKRQRKKVCTRAGWTAATRRAGQCIPASKHPLQACRVLPAAGS